MKRVSFYLFAIQLCHVVVLGISTKLQTTVEICFDVEQRYEQFKVELRGEHESRIRFYQYKDWYFCDWDIGTVHWPRSDCISGCALVTLVSSCNWGPTKYHQNYVSEFYIQNFLNKETSPVSQATVRKMRIYEPNLRKLISCNGWNSTIIEDHWTVCYEAETYSEDIPLRIPHFPSCESSKPPYVPPKPKTTPKPVTIIPAELTELPDLQIIDEDEEPEEEKQSIQDKTRVGEISEKTNRTAEDVILDVGEEISKIDEELDEEEEVKETLVEIINDDNDEDDIEDLSLQEEKILKNTTILYCYQNAKLDTIWRKRPFLWTTVQFMDRDHTCPRKEKAYIYGLDIQCEQGCAIIQVESSCNFEPGNSIYEVYVRRLFPDWYKKVEITKFHIYEPGIENVFDCLDPNIKRVYVPGSNRIRCFPTPGRIPNKHDSFARLYTPYCKIMGQPQNEMQIPSIPELADVYGNNFMMNDRHVRILKSKKKLSKKNVPMIKYDEIKEAKIIIWYHASKYIEKARDIRYYPKAPVTVRLAQRGHWNSCTYSIGEISWPRNAHCEVGFILIKFIPMCRFGKNESDPNVLTKMEDVYISNLIDPEQNDVIAMNITELLVINPNMGITGIRYSEVPIDKPGKHWIQLQKERKYENEIMTPDRAICKELKIYKEYVVDIENIGKKYPVAVPVINLVHYLASKSAKENMFVNSEKNLQIAHQYLENKKNREITEVLVPNTGSRVKFCYTNGVIDESKFIPQLTYTVKARLHQSGRWKDCIVNNHAKIYGLHERCLRGCAIMQMESFCNYDRIDDIDEVWLRPLFPEWYKEVILRSITLYDSNINIIYSCKAERATHYKGKTKQSILKEVWLKCSRKKYQYNTSERITNKEKIPYCETVADL
ncbi:hypothetical protein SNEBB_009685 [Seison nebaliae]|nr:hypothetical protein SNEBB_009685 [Seison nebaliae]